MELYIGGYAQGKLECVRKKYPKADIFDETNYKALTGYEVQKQKTESSRQASCKTGDEKLESGGIIVNHVNLIIREMLLREIEKDKIIEGFKRQVHDYPDMIFICDEVGNGIVPMEPFERKYREAVGKTQIALADIADGVWRVFCGIAQQIK